MYDTIRHRLGDHWEHDGTDWNLRTPSASPSTRTGSAAAFHPGLQRVLIFGGLGSTRYCSDTWAWKQQARPAKEPSLHLQAQQEPGHGRARRYDELSPADVGTGGFAEHFAQCHASRCLMGEGKGTPFREGIWRLHVDDRGTMRLDVSKSRQLCFMTTTTDHQSPRTYSVEDYRKHKRPGGWGSPCPRELTLAGAQDLLNGGVRVDDAIYNVDGPHVYRAFEHEAGKWHGHPIPWKRLPVLAKSALIAAGRLDIAMYRKALRQGWGDEYE